MKNGWMPQGPASQWVINSIGVISHHHQRPLIAVLTSGQPTQQAGIRQAQAAAKAAAAAITSTTPPCPRLNDARSSTVMAGQLPSAPAQA